MVDNISFIKIYKNENTANIKENFKKFDGKCQILISYTHPKKYVYFFSSIY
jgi:hypothetical protein